MQPDDLRADQGIVRWTDRDETVTVTQQSMLPELTTEASVTIVAPRRWRKPAPDVVYGALAEARHKIAAAGNVA